MKDTLEHFNKVTKRAAKLGWVGILFFLCSLIAFIVLNAVFAGFAFLTATALVFLLMIALEKRINQTFRKNYLAPTVKNYFNNFLESVVDTGFYAIDAHTLNKKAITYDDFIEAGMFDFKVNKVKAYDALYGTYKHYPFKSSDVKVRGTRVMYQNNTKQVVTENIYTGRLIKITLPSPFKGHLKYYSEAHHALPKFVEKFSANSLRDNTYDASSEAHIYPIKNDALHVGQSAYTSDKTFADHFFNEKTKTALDALHDEHSVGLFIHLSNNTLFYGVKNTGFKAHNRLTLEMPLTAPIDTASVEAVKAITQKLAQLTDTIVENDDLFQ